MNEKDVNEKDVNEKHMDRENHRNQEHKLGLLILNLSKKRKKSEALLADAVRGSAVAVLTLETGKIEAFLDMLFSGSRNCARGSETGVRGSETGVRGSETAACGGETESCGILHCGISSGELSPSQILAVTDSEAAAQKFAGCGIACIGCAAEEAGYFEGAGMVTDEPEQLGPEEMEEYLFRQNGWPVQVAETKRLILQEMTEADREKLSEISRQDGMEYVQGRPDSDFFEEETFRAYLAYAYRLQGYGLWSVRRRDGALIGCCGLADVQAADGTCRLELQYMLDRGFWRQGLGTEMCLAALGYAFARTEWDEVWLRVHEKNLASIRLARKLGFVCETGGTVQEWRKRIS